MLRNSSHPPHTHPTIFVDVHAPMRACRVACTLRAAAQSLIRLRRSVCVRALPVCCPGWCRMSWVTRRTHILKQCAYKSGGYVRCIKICQDGARHSSAPSLQVSFSRSDCDDYHRGFLPGDRMGRRHQNCPLGRCQDRFAFSTFVNVLNVFVNFWETE